jgi:hypothetical protein
MMMMIQRRKSHSHPTHRKGTSLSILIRIIRDSERRDTQNHLITDEKDIGI